MLWAFHNECYSGAPFTLNCYRHWATLVIMDNRITSNFLYIKEVKIQGDPQVMVTYGLRVLPLIR